ncbi:hypothetical protein [Salinisphaera sp. Q1T1-3]|uniref:hypothetical protein n=1 Tax=Salinisphaera sp. Q1T1-3 TaxID=2321229 RepID=UPI0018F723E2|nr:hypothetical protein [Salinisphaera sp. Q1T1-3]
MAQQAAEKTEHDGWYKYGVTFLFAEMGIAICVCGYSLFMAFTGSGGFPGH